MGFAIGVLSVLGYAWVHLTLGDNWSPVLEIRKDHQLVTSGPYHFVRHPMYFFIWLGVTGMTLMIGNSVFVLAAFSSTFLLSVVRIPDEERLLTGHFGNYNTNLYLPFNFPLATFTSIRSSPS